jgi:hypothetical protein
VNEQRKFNGKRTFFLINGPHAKQNKKESPHTLTPFTKLNSK